MFSRKDNDEISHNEKMARAAKDTKDILFLLALLLVIVCVWDIWTRYQVDSLREENEIHAEVRVKLDEMVTPSIARKLYTPDQNYDEDIDLRKHVQKVMSNLNVLRDEKERILQPTVEQLSQNTRHEYVVVKKIQTIELNRLVHFLIAVRGPKDDVWCTKLDDLKPVLDGEGYAVVTTKGDPVYNIESLKVSRFTESIQ